MKTLNELGTSPAPWTATADADGGVVVNDENRHGIAACGHTAEGDVNFANARLISAAPDLYEMLREACKMYCAICAYWKEREEKYCPSCHVWRRWHKALEKAGGAK